MTTIHCPMIHGGLQINLKKSPKHTYINHCCLRGDLIPSDQLWQEPTLASLRELNQSEQWHPGCWTCQGNEAAGLTSFRTGMLKQFGVKTNLSGPQRLDLMFDVGCNLACRTCGPELSTYWQKHMLDHGLPLRRVPTTASRADDMIKLLEQMDLSNLGQVVFCGGETLLGQGYWRVADALADLVPNARDRLTVCFQTNGTQPISDRNYDTIEKFQLVRLNISLDGVGERFNYLRWPADWNQVTDNILKIRQTAPPNVMLLIEETLSIFNLFYTNELKDWLRNNFSTDGRGDVIEHTQHVATGNFTIEGITQEYFDALPADTKKLMLPNWREQPFIIHRALAEIRKFDAIRNQNWQHTFPDLIDFYKRYANSGA